MSASEVHPQLIADHLAATFRNGEVTSATEKMLARLPAQWRTFARDMSAGRTDTAKTFLSRRVAEFEERTGTRSGQVLHHGGVVGGDL